MTVIRLPIFDRYIGIDYSRWRRLADERAGAKSVFHFDVPDS
jgi:hypothetical protein